MRSTCYKTHLLFLMMLFEVISIANAEAPLSVWSIDFNDPAEPGRWELDPMVGLGSDQIKWKLVPRTSTGSKRGMVLQFSATADLSIETHYLLYRRFPPEFRPNPTSDLLFEWEWMISDTDISDAVTLSILTEPRDYLNTCFSIISHSRFTIGWPVLFEPSNKWLHRRIAFPSKMCHGNSKRPKRSTGIILDFVNPVKLVVGLASLTIEEWPRGSLRPDPVLMPHRAPPPEKPFDELPVGQLRHATAGALEDLDGDGLPEMLILERRGYAHLYRNSGDGYYSEELTEKAGLAFETMGTGAMFLDLDADYDADLIVTSEFSVPRFFENIGGVQFRERIFLNEKHLSFWYGAAAEDIDRDGDPDLLFVSPLERHFLFLRNQGDWKFREEILFQEKDLVGQGSLNFSCSFGDMDEDGWPDLFLGREFVFRNLRGQFVLDPEPWGMPHHAKTEGGIWADLTGDGKVDLLVLRDTAESIAGTRLFVGDGDGRFMARTMESGLPTLDSAEVSLAEDFNLDGNLDLYICQRERPNYLLLNDGRGHFVDATEESGFTDMGRCDAALAGDLNGDGKIDIVILRYGSPPALLFNDLKCGRWIGVVIVGETPGTGAIGARTQFLDSKSGQPISTRWTRRGRGFGSVGPSDLYIGIGNRSYGDVKIYFPNGRTRLLKGIQAGSTNLIREDTGQISSILRRWVAEFRFDFVRYYRRHLAIRGAFLWLIVAAAFLGGVSLFSRPVVRLLAIGYLVVGIVAGLLFGSTPGQGPSRSPPILWTAGAIAGAVASVGATTVLRSLRGKKRRRVGDIQAQLEDLVRFTLDFRHAGVDTRALVSIESRVQNLFIENRLNVPFFQQLRQLAERYPVGTGHQLRRLLETAKTAFPDLPGIIQLDELGRHVETHLLQLARLGGDGAQLRRWRRELLPELRECREAVTAMLVRLDILCSCNLDETLDEACALQTDQLRKLGASLRIHYQGNGPRRVLIERNHLMMILENLFTSSFVALKDQPERCIEITVRRAERKTTLRFRDSGPGVDPAVGDRIFEYGFTTRSTGKGYGLARTREILGHFGGGIILEEASCGASFLITLRSVHEK